MYNNNQLYNYNMAEGTIGKSDSHTKFTKCHMNSQLSKNIFNEINPKINDKDIEVIQVMVCGNENLIVEYSIIEKKAPWRNK